MAMPHCVGCGSTDGAWWWWCPAHRVWECHRCSRPGAYRPVEHGTHRSSCAVEGVKRTSGSLLVTWTLDPGAVPGEVPAVLSS